MGSLPVEIWRQIIFETASYDPRASFQQDIRSEPYRFAHARQSGRRMRQTSHQLATLARVCFKWYRLTEPALYDHLICDTIQDLRSLQTTLERRNLSLGDNNLETDYSLGKWTRKITIGKIRGRRMVVTPTSYVEVLVRLITACPSLEYICISGFTRISGESSLKTPARVLSALAPSVASVIWNGGELANPKAISNNNSVRNNLVSLWLHNGLGSQHGIPHFPRLEFLGITSCSSLNHDLHLWELPALRSVAIEFSDDFRGELSELRLFFQAYGKKLNTLVLRVEEEFNNLWTHIPSFVFDACPNLQHLGFPPAVVGIDQETLTQEYPSLQSIQLYYSHRLARLARIRQVNEPRYLFADKMFPKLQMVHIVLSALSKLDVTDSLVRNCSKIVGKERIVVHMD